MVRVVWTSILQILKTQEANPPDKLVEALKNLSHNENLDIAEALASSPTIHFD